VPGTKPRWGAALLLLVLTGLLLLLLVITFLPIYVHVDFP
jgi:hypothetical protein